VVKTSSGPLLNKSSISKKVFKISLNDVKIAAPRKKRKSDLIGGCIKPNVLIAAKIVKFPLNPKVIAQSIATNVTPSIGQLHKN